MNFKLYSAQELCLELNLPIIYKRVELYKMLNGLNYRWDARRQKWVEPLLPDPPSEHIYVRIRTGNHQIEKAIEIFRFAFENIPLKLIKQTSINTPNPPQTNDRKISFVFDFDEE